MCDLVNNYCFLNIVLLLFDFTPFCVWVNALVWLHHWHRFFFLIFI